MCSEDTVQLFRAHVAIISEHIEMDVHSFLLSIRYAENVDALRSDGQGFRQEVPERLQLTLPFDVRVDKISRGSAFRRQRGRRSCGKNYRLVNDNYGADQSLVSSSLH